MLEEAPKKISFKTKEARRRKKYCNVLSRDYDYDPDILKACGASQVLSICNAGLSTGLSREQLLDLALEFGPVKNITLVPGKSSSFLEFFSKDVAALAYTGLHGRAIPSLKSGELFLAFVPHAPQCSLEGIGRQNLVTGLEILPDFISKEDEASLLNSIDWETPNPRASQALKHRKVRHYGYQFDYNTNNVNPEDPLTEKFPSECEGLFSKLVNEDLVPWKPDQMTVNQYQPGQGIPPHIDTHSPFEDPILSLSLGSDVVMEFRKGNQVVPIFLPQRSLLIMRGEARYCWSHGITPRKSDIVPCLEGGVTLQQRGVRTSFTLRRVRSGPCTCKYPQFCDSQQVKTSHIIEEEKTAAKLEELHVHQVYEQIAPHFSDTRHKPWPQVQNFVQSQPPGCVILDVGCGNGKYLGLNPLAFQVGCDSSTQLLKVCRERNFESLTCNCLYLPMLSKSVDCCISIAVIHHLSTEERRLKALEEMERVLRPGGCALVYVWARDQEREKVKSSYLRQGAAQPEENVPASPFRLPVHTNRTPFSHPDMLVPWKLRPSEENASREVFYRYYHVFEEGELEALCEHVPNFKVTRSYYDQGNWCVVIQKL